MEAKKLTPTDMDNVRKLLLGQNNRVITDAVKGDARNMVADVISESIHDRQQRDNSLTKAMTPLIESAVEQSIESNKSKFVSYLYPIVGSLVRKSVSVFFNGFLEKLNYLIEYSLTLKGMKWRFRAWQKGIPFNQYILRKTFNYRVEQVFFIHRETGSLLCNVASDNTQFNDPSLVSAMLTAINDFVADSFHQAQDTHLDTIKTEHFTLAVEAGPDALLVAAVAGNMPNDIKSILKHTLEELHELYGEELGNFTGDDSPFTAADNHLRGCLISELSSQAVDKKKTPWAAWFVITLFMLGIFYWGAIQWQSSQLIKRIEAFQLPAGIKILSVQKHDNQQLIIDYIADPFSEDLPAWIEQQGVNTDPLLFSLTPILSTNKEIILKKAIAILPFSNIDIRLSEHELLLSGQLSQPFPIELIGQLQGIPGVNTVDIRELIQPESILKEGDSLLALWQKYVSSINMAQIQFAIDSAELNYASQQQVKGIAQQLLITLKLSERLNKSIGIIISGYSDASGNQEKNLALSKQRALAVKTELMQQGVDADKLFTVGSGELQINGFESAGRKVLFSLIHDMPNTAIKDEQ